MRLLLVSATEAEIAPLIKELRLYHEMSPRLRSYEYSGKSIDVLITGVGMTATAAWVSKALSGGKYSGALNVGICGTFDRDLFLGNVVRITEDFFPEMGAEDGNEFLTIHQLNLQDPNEAPFVNGKLCASKSSYFNWFDKLDYCRGITVNRVHGNDHSIKEVVERLNPQVESMEGAGFYYACSLFDIPALQVRAISNYVERRNRENWRINDAVENLNKTIVDFLKS